jgi:Protein of unknown function DUF72
MPRANTATRWKEPTREERRERRRLRREKQREDSVGRAAKMHLARKELNSAGSSSTPRLKAAYVGCSGWRYWKWRGCSIPRISLRYSKARLNAIVSQLDPARRSAVEFRHASWWNEEVYSAFREAGIIFCSCSGPRLPVSLSGRLTKYTYAALTQALVSAFKRTSSWSGRTGLKQVGRREPGSISIMITMPMRQKTRLLCGAC